MFVLSVFIISFLLGFITFLFYPKSKKGAADVPFLVFISTAFLLFAIDLFTAKIVAVKHEDIKIYSTLSSSQQKITGRFILGTGTINSQEYYFANVETKPNQFERIYIPVDKVIRIIDNNLTDYAIYRKFYCVKKSLVDTSELQTCYPTKKDILFIPKNSIVKQLKFQ